MYFNVHYFITECPKIYRKICTASAKVQICGILWDTDQFNEIASARSSKSGINKDIGCRSGPVQLYTNSSLSLSPSSLSRSLFFVSLSFLSRSLFSLLFSLFSLSCSLFFLSLYLQWSKGGIGGNPPSNSLANFFNIMHKNHYLPIQINAITVQICGNF